MGQNVFGLTEMHHRRGQQGDARVAMLFVVPLKEVLTKGSTVLNGAEAIRKFRAVLHGSKLTFRIWIVVGNVGSAVGLGDAKVRHEKSNGLGSHDTAAVCMDV